jgi:hypothetical protein
MGYETYIKSTPLWGVSQNRVNNTYNLLTFLWIECIGERRGKLALIVVKILTRGSCKLVFQCKAGSISAPIRISFPTTPKPSFTILLPSIDPGLTAMTTGPSSGSAESILSKSSSFLNYIHASGRHDLAR